MKHSIRQALYSGTSSTWLRDPTKNMQEIPRSSINFILKSPFQYRYICICAARNCQEVLENVACCIKMLP
uniref:Uncharacterized protein n=1 Tax=Arion vulgaris TaxID=1028688 RepID=A0A0B6ZCB0_9EUPU